MSAATQDSKPKLPSLLEQVQQRGLATTEWYTMLNLFPGAKPASILMVVDYCKARKLDPLKKPCHIVPMWVKDAITGEGGMRDVVMPGIYEYRTTAHRTGRYAGHTEPTYGPEIEYKGVKAPEWCAMTMRKRSVIEGQIAIDEYPVKVYFREVVGTDRNGNVNDRWTRAPIQMLTKCTEAAGLRDAFPDELGGEMAAEEADAGAGRVIDVTPRAEASADPVQDLNAELGLAQAPREPGSDDAPDPEFVAGYDGAQ